MVSDRWVEKIAPDEAERHRAQAAFFVKLQEQRVGRYGAGRSLHRTQVAALHAEVRVDENLPDYARRGMFAAPVTYQARIRLSNGGFDPAPDRAPNIRGFAIKVLGVSGEAALGGQADSQNFTLINRETLSVGNSADFTKIVEIGSSRPVAMLGAIVRKPSVVPKIATALKDFKAPFSGFATESFYSVAPVAFGAYAARLKLSATTSTVNQAASDDWSADVYSRLVGGPLEYVVQAQFFEDEQRTPIEDPTVNWNAPYIDVARLVIPSQQSDDGLRDAAERDDFSPWNCLRDHRPLGEIMRARRAAYAASRRTRSEA
jgi:hypothetical protein